MGWPGSWPSEHPTRQEWAAQWEPGWGGAIFFSGTGFPVGLTAKVSGLQNPGRACLTQLGSTGQPTGLASPAKANTGNARETSMSRHLIFSGWQGALAFSSSAVRSRALVPGDAPSPSLSFWALSPWQKKQGKRTGDQQAVRGARRCPGRRPLGCCWNPVSGPCSFEESCKGSSPLRRPRKESDGQTVVNAGRRRGD